MAEPRTPLPTDRADLARALFAESADALFLVDPKTDRLLDANPAAQQLTGFRRSDLLQFAAAELFRPESADRSVTPLPAPEDAGPDRPSPDDMLLRTRSPGTWVPVSVTATRLALTPRSLDLITVRDRREERVMLEALRASRERLEQVLEATVEGIIFVDRDGRIRLTNPEAARISGYDRDALVGRPWAEVVAAWTHPDGRPVAPEERADVRVLRRDENVTGASRACVRADGSRVVIRGNAVPLRDAAGHVTGMVASFRDVTEQHEATRALRRSEERFRTLVEKGSDAIALIGVDGRILYMSPSAALAPDARAEDSFGRLALENLHPEDRAAIPTLLARCLAEPDSDVPLRVRARRADGAWRHIEGVARNRLADPNVGAIVVNYRDVTERVRAEEELAGQHTLLRAVLDSIPDLICHKDTAGVFRGCNTAFADFLGRTPAEVVGRTTAELFPPEVAVTLEDVDRRILAGGPPERLEVWGDYRDGRRALFETLRVPLVGSDGQLLGLIGIGRDITPRRQLEDQLRQAGKMEAVGQLAGGVAHDFNNLLTAVLGHLALAQELLAADHPVRALAAAAEKAAWRAAELTRQLLGFARRTTLLLGPTDPATCIAETVGLLRRAIDPRIAIHVRAEPDPGPVLADGGQLTQVLMNLCLNARDAMPDGGRLTLSAAAVTVDAAHAGRHVAARVGEFVRLSVADTGGGIPPAVREHIFEPFFTTKGPGRGTGLGLAMVHGIVQQHRGWVEVESAPGRGSRFDVYLPRAPRALAAPAPTPAAAGAPRAAAPARGTETILLADDEPLVRNLARISLEQYGYRVLVAADGQEAVDVYLREGARIDLVILDLTMPRLSGRDACREMVRLNPRVRVLLSSGYAPDSNTTLHEPGVYGFVGKPYRPSELAAAVRGILDAKS